MNDEEKKVLDDNIQETIDEMESRIAELNAECQDQKVDDEDLKVKLNELKALTADIIKTVITKIKEGAAKAQYDEKFQKFVADAKEDVKSGVDYTLNKIKAMKDNPQNKEKIDKFNADIEERITKFKGSTAEAYDKFLQNDIVHDVVSNISRATDAIHDNFEELRQNPKVNETVEKAKDAAINLAEKSADAFKKFLKPEDKEDKEDKE